MGTPVQLIEVVPYDPVWSRHFDELCAVLAQQLGPLTVRIEHVGSTSVPGLAAKPVIDIDVVIAERVDLPDTIAALQELGYEHQGDLGIAGREAFRRLGRDVPRNGSGRDWPVHYLYVCSADNRELRRHLALRDYLRQHPEQVAAYGTLKQQLAVQYRSDIESYTEAKTAFIVSILQQIAPDTT